MSLSQQRCLCHLRHEGHERDRSHLHGPSPIDKYSENPTYRPVKDNITNMYLYVLIMPDKDRNKYYKSVE